MSYPDIESFFKAAAEYFPFGFAMFFMVTLLPSICVHHLLSRYGHRRKPGFDIFMRTCILHVPSKVKRNDICVRFLVPACRNRLPDPGSLYRLYLENVKLSYDIYDTERSDRSRASPIVTVPCETIYQGAASRK
jgi:hypothetical protein